MGQILVAFPEQPAFLQTVTLGDLQFGVRLTWKHRLGAWYADVYQANGTAILLGQRVSPGWAVGLGLNASGRPDGTLYVRGPSDYNRADLGNTVELVFYSTAEIAAVQAAAVSDADAVTITIP